MAKSKKSAAVDAAALVTATVPVLAAQQAEAIMAAEAAPAAEPTPPKVPATPPDGTPLPVLNRIVRYVMPDGTARSAIVTRSFPGLHVANLQVFRDGPKDEEHGNLTTWHQSVPYAPAEDATPGTWHWPPAPPR